MSRRTLIQMLIPYLAVGLALLAAATDGGAGALPAPTAAAEAFALVDVGQRLCHSFAGAEATSGRLEASIAATTR